MKQNKPAGVGRAVDRVRRAAIAESQAHWYSRPVQPNTVFYEAFSGNGLLCNPAAIFRSLLNAPDMQHLRHIWVLSDFDMYSETVAEFEGDDRVDFVRAGSGDYRQALATSQYLVNNATFPPEFCKRAGQTYVNTWHGTPLKRMGYDTPGGGPEARNVLRNFVAADYLVSSGDFMTRTMYLGAYRLSNIFRGTIIESGAPRVDQQFESASAPGIVREDLRRRGLSLTRDRLALYAPTWRGASFSSPEAQVGRLRQTLDRLRGAQGCSDTDIILKVHQAVYDQAVHDESLSKHLVPNDILTNTLLAAVDVLVTDYSSIFFDYASLHRPIIFHVPDIDHYDANRGFYLDPDEWPGPITRSLDELVEALSEHRSTDPTGADGRADFLERFAPHDDGGATQRVVDVVFRQRQDDCTVLTDFDDGRTSMVIYLGGLLRNGITMSALNLLDNIDHDRYDVSVTYQYGTRRDQRQLEAMINERVRLFPRIGGIGGSKLLRPSRNALLRRGKDTPVPKRDRIMGVFREEWHRCLGDSRFEHVIDFSGYGPFWAYVLSQAPSGVKSIWLHNDLEADARREIDGHRPHERSLNTIFSTYHDFDRLVSVSDALSDINRRKLAGYADSDKFTSARNTIHEQRILDSAHGRSVDADGDADSPLPTDPAEAIAAIVERHGAEWLDEEIARQRVVQEWFGRDKRITFVTVGRLSPEKNHDRLIRAFQGIHQRHPGTRLLIIGGGPLEDDLTATIADLGLRGAVHLTGQQQNPFAILARSDCFVLSSDYEGQPMVILEAKILGVPVITTRFDSARSALDADEGLIVERSVDALAEGMQAFLDGRVKAKPFDAPSYNRRAMDEFYAAIGAPTESR